MIEAAVVLYGGKPLYLIISQQRAGTGDSSLYTIQASKSHS